MSSMYIRFLIFYCDLLSLHPVVHFLSMWLSVIMAIMKSNDDRASPWSIPIWIFASAKLFPPAVNSTLLVFMIFSINFMTSCDILFILKQFITQLYRTTIIIIWNYTAVCKLFMLHRNTWWIELLTFEYWNSHNHLTNDKSSSSSSSSSSCRVGSTYIPDPLSLLFPIVHRLRQVFWTTSHILI